MIQLIFRNTSSLPGPKDRRDMEQIIAFTTGSDNIIDYTSIVLAVA